jgi:hypothetical protein
MKIIHLETHIVAVPPPHVGGMYWIFVKLRTTCGIEGVGEVYAASFHPRVMAMAIDDVFQRCLEGHDPHHIERLFRSAYASGFTQRPDLTMMGVLSGLEMACWDIIGKAAEQPARCATQALACWCTDHCMTNLSVDSWPAPWRCTNPVIRWTQPPPWGHWPVTPI